MRICSVHYVIKIRAYPVILDTDQLENDSNIY